MTYRQYDSCKKSLNEPPFRNPYVRYNGIAEDLEEKRKREIKSNHYKKYIGNQKRECTTDDYVWLSSPFTNSPNFMTQKPARFEVIGKLLSINIDQMDLKQVPNKSYFLKS